MILRRDTVILVNDQDEWIGTADKMAVHRTGALHRAISIFITNSKGELLLQQRAEEKYHSGGLWTNSCCTHAMLGEPITMTAYRRIQEEIGIDPLLHCVAKERYRSDVTDGLIEHEYDHIYTGEWNGDVFPAPEEVKDTKWISLEVLDAWLEAEPEAFTAWFPILLKVWREAMELPEMAMANP